MAYKDTSKHSEASVWEVKRRGVKGITLVLYYEVSGPKHQTGVRHTFELSFCDMRQMGRQFHVIMDQLSKEWHEAKDAISGK